VRRTVKTEIKPHRTNAKGVCLADAGSALRLSDDSEGVEILDDFVTVSPRRLGARAGARAGSQEVRCRGRVEAWRHSVGARTTGAAVRDAVDGQEQEDKAGALNRQGLAVFLLIFYT